MSLNANAKKRVALVGAPLALGQSLAGVGLAPQVLRQAGLGQVITELGYELMDKGDLVFRVEEVTPISPVTGAGAAVTLSRVKHAQAVGQACRELAQAVEQLATGDNFVLTLGGDHSVALGSIAGLWRARPETALVWVDAHGDFNTPETSLSGNLHGMPLAALLGQLTPGLPGFEWLQGVSVSPERVALVGVRSLDEAERQLLKATGVQVYTMSAIDRYGIGPIMERAMAAVNPTGKLGYHVSFDIDAIDPQEAPGTGTTARGGLTYREGHTIVEMLAATDKLGSMDLVEINPELDRNDLTITLGIELIASALGKAIF